LGLILRIGKRFARSAKAHLIDDETVAKMGHPVLVDLDVGHPSQTTTTVTTKADPPFDFAQGKLCGDDNRKATAKAKCGSLSAALLTIVP
jgi:hypothetical protein